MVDQRRRQLIGYGVAGLTGMATTAVATNDKQNGREQPSGCGEATIETATVDAEAWNATIHGRITNFGPHHYVHGVMQIRDVNQPDWDKWENTVKIWNPKVIINNADESDLPEDGEDTIGPEFKTTWTDQDPININPETEYEYRAIAYLPSFPGERTINGEWKSFETTEHIVSTTGDIPTTETTTGTPTDGGDDSFTTDPGDVTPPPTTATETNTPEPSTATETESANLTPDSVEFYTETPESEGTTTTAREEMGFSLPEWARSLFGLGNSSGR